MGCLLEVSEEDAGKADGGEVIDSSDNLVGSRQGYLELIPDDFLTSLAGVYLRYLLVGDIVAPDFEILGADGDFILEIALVFIERIVLVDILDIGVGER